MSENRFFTKKKETLRNQQSVACFQQNQQCWTYFGQISWVPSQDPSFMSYWMAKESHQPPARHRWEKLAPELCPSVGFRHGSCSTHSCQEHINTGLQGHCRHSSVLQCVTSHKSRTCFSPVSCQMFCGSVWLVSLLGTWVQECPCHTHLSKGVKLFFPAKFSGVCRLHPH